MTKDGKPYELTRDEAIRLHLQMWSDMQKELGDKPIAIERIEYKVRWLESHGYENVAADCFLCEYAKRMWRQNCGLSYASKCQYCPIVWSPLSKYGVSYCGDRYKDGGHDIYLCAPISEILALPERKVSNDNA